MNWWINLLVVTIPALTAVAAAVIAGLYAKSSKANELEAQRLRDLEQRISERKYKVYEPMLELFGQILTSDKQKQQLALRAVPEMASRFVSWISIYGSDDAIRAFRNFMQASFASPPSLIAVRLYADFLLAARRDIGYSNTKVTAEELLGLRINDLYRGDPPWYVSEPFDVVCEKLGWSPPWPADR